MEFSNWMSNLPEKYLNAPLTSLAIPGTHDSLSYTITPDADVSPDSEPAVKLLVKCFGPLVRRFIYKWCVTQSIDVMTQLHLGIRYFDIRLSVKDEDKNFYFVHGLYGGSIKKPFEEIIQFLNNNEGEVVILDLQHFYIFSEDDHERLMTFIDNIFGEMLCPKPNDMDTVNLNWMKENNFKVIVIYRHHLSFSKNNLWSSNSWPTPWPNTMSTDYLKDFLNNGLATRSDKYGFVSQCVLTPTKTTVLRHPWSGVRNKCALPASQVVIPWLQKQYPGSVNVAIADYVQDNNGLFSTTVISLNVSRELDE